MADAQAHEGQATRNRQFYRSIGGQNSEFLDWAMTVLFYVAVHDCTTAILNRHESAPKDHDERARKLHELRLDAAYATYQTLRNEANKARYDCVSIDPERVRHCEALALNQLPKELGLVQN